MVNPADFYNKVIFYLVIAQASMKFKRTSLPGLERTLHCPHVPGK